MTTGTGTTITRTKTMSATEVENYFSLYVYVVNNVIADIHSPKNASKKLRELFTGPYQSDYCTIKTFCFIIRGPLGALVLFFSFFVYLICRTQNEFAVATVIDQLCRTFDDGFQLFSLSFSIALSRSLFRSTFSFSLQANVTRNRIRSSFFFS